MKHATRVTPSSPLPLETPWVMYVHSSSARGSYKNDYATLIRFDNVEDFWRIMHNAPHVSQLAGGGHAVLYQKCHVVGAFSVFREGITPEWEDVHNTHGGEWYYRFPSGTCSLHLNKIWLYVLLALIGEQWEGCTGARIVNRQTGNKVTQKLEVWFGTHVAYESLRVAQTLPMFTDDSTNGWVWMNHGQ